MPDSKSDQESSERYGQSALPLARIKRIIRADEDIAQCSTNATFLIAAATEMFVQYLAEQAYTVVKSNNMKSLRYNDIATAVARIDNLEFLSDVIPKTTTYGKFKEKKAKEKAKRGGKVPVQQTLNEMPGGKRRTPESRREESMVNLDDQSGETHLQSPPRPLMVIHSSRSRNKSEEENDHGKMNDDTDTDNDDHDVDMT
ncbi:hypothetical protein FQN57_000581 [Myotisia sp. PD_48]|nr:hypothetical protein FQN57_000581 [Myotisia sp. PD_48]